MLRRIITHSTKYVIAGIVALGISIGGIATPAMAVDGTVPEGPSVSLANPQEDNKYTNQEFLQLVVTDPDGVKSVTIKIVTKSKKVIAENTDVVATPLTPYTLDVNLGGLNGTYTAIVYAYDALGNPTPVDFTYTFTVKRG